MFRKYFDLKFDRFWVIAILAVAFLFRFWGIASLPKGFNADEASFGYDAYSILKTGRDQWGNFLPPVLKSFGDYKAPLYSYLTVPSVAFFGLNEFAVRLPSAVIGTLAVLILFFLAREIFSGIKFPIPHLASILLALSPWHVMLGRAAIEANLTTFFLPAGILFFLKGIKKPPFLILSALFFGLSLLTYHSAKLLTPIIIFGCLLIFRKPLRDLSLKTLSVPIIVISIFILIFLNTFRIGGGSRISERSITSGALEAGAVKKIELINSGMNPTKARLIHNKFTVVASRFWGNYRQYFSWRFAKEGVSESYYAMIPGIGIVYTLELVFATGVLFLLRNRKDKNLVLILFAWLLLAPLPAALATGAGFSGTRASGMLPVIQLIAALGIYGWFTVLGKKKYLPFIGGVLAVITLTMQVRSFVNEYKNTETSMSWGNMEVARWLHQNRGLRDVIVSRSLSEPQIFIAFTGAWDPTNYQEASKSWKIEEAGVAWVDQLPEWRLGPYVFRSIDWTKDSKLTDALIVARPEEFPPDTAVLYEVKYPDGSPAIYIVATKQKAYAKNFGSH